MPGVTTRFSLLRDIEQASTFAQDVRSGLSARPKRLLPQYFYDELGSALFDAICYLPEYYLTRAETEILSRYAGEIAEALGSPTRLVELGSGYARKTRFLISELQAKREIEYVPVDVDAAILERAGRDLLSDYPALSVTAVAGDFRQPPKPLRELLAQRRNTAVLFLGSTIGNLDPADATAMLRQIRGLLASGAALLVGIDLRKPKPVLEAAYNDALGITAAFNRNILQRINRELGGDFDVSAFDHRAFYDEQQGRIEMHLVSLRDQTARIEALAMEVAFAEGESIHTENSYKYDEALIAGMAVASGFELDRLWTDSRGWFADCLLIAR